ncbi:MAG: type II secretion system F family protein [Zoogloeaceae bacterium]|nr:type II secretion system F family protein [Zoogloeaceae bacterium]
MRYAYRAIDQSGARVRGEIVALSQDDLDARLTARGLYLIDAQERENAGKAASGKARGRGEPSRREWLFFWTQFRELLAAGVPLQEILSDLADARGQTRGREARLGVILAALAEEIRAGRSLSEAMQKEEAHFRPVFTRLIHAGETAGRLEEAVAHLIGELAWEDDLARRARRLFLYPAFVLAVIFAATLFLFLYLVPQLKVFFVNMGGILPWQTQALFFVADFVGAAWPFLLLGMASFAAVCVAPPSFFPALRLFRDAALFRLPVVGDAVRKIALARFSGAFALLYASGVSVLEALAMTRDVAGNRAIAEVLVRAEADIRAGHAVSAAFSASGIFPAFALRMLRVGETTGALDRALLSIRHFYTRSVEESAERLESVLEPSLTVLLGLLLGWVIWAVIGPVYDVAAQAGF